MRQNTAWSLGLGILLALAGCIPSLHPLLTEEEAVFDPALVGTWGKKDSQEAWTFAKDDEKTYTVVYTDDKGQKGHFTGRLGMVKGRLFLDLFPKETEVQENDFYKIHWLPGHTFLRVNWGGPELRMELLSPKWLGELLEKDPAAIKHEKVDGRVILTASTKDLQAFIAAHEKTEKAWHPLDPLYRKVAEGK